MTSPPLPSPPSWPHCGYGADVTIDPVGCRGIHVTGHTACLAHLSEAERDTYLAGLAPGADIDHRGTPFTEELLDQLIRALCDHTTGKPKMGTAKFNGAQFSSDVRFDEVQFSGDAWFDGAQFSGDARFPQVRFSGDAWFRGAQFSSDAQFGGAQFSGDARFPQVQFSSHAWFAGAQFSFNAGFSGAQFSDPAWFDRAQFSGHASFDGAQFSFNAQFDEAQFSDSASFGGAQFSHRASFGGVQFSGDARFDGAQFSGFASFGEVQFSDYASFGGAQFSHDAWFDEAHFSDSASFVRARFSGDASFGGAQFSSDGQFSGAQFSGDVRFHGAQFSGDALFDGTRFSGASVLGPLVCARVVDLSGAVFEMPVTLEIAAREMRCERTRWESTATMRLRYATADLGHAVLSAPVAVTAHPAPFTTGFGVTVGESLLSGCGHDVRIASVQGVDAAHLVLTDTDLTDCLFSGAFHLDQLRLEGCYTFAAAPLGLRRHRVLPVRWTPRRTLAEEHHWRATRNVGAEGWTPASDGNGVLKPAALAPVYRQLRKAFEDSKHEPGAADFYYGEMEMRRYAHDIPRGERALLTMYWLLSGYGLRASRALGWLAIAMMTTILLMMGLGLPSESPKQEATGVVPPGGGRVTFAIDKDDPKNPTRDRFTTERFEKSLNITLNSVVFRSSSQDLTTTGTYVEMASRLLEPTLLALAALAVRGRIKR